MTKPSNATSIKVAGKSNFLMVAFMLFVFLFVATTLVTLTANSRRFNGKTMLSNDPEQALKAAPIDPLKRDSIPVDGSAVVPEGLYGPDGKPRFSRERNDSDQIRHGVER